MTTRTTITLDDNNLHFLDAIAGGNRSSFINRLLDKERKLRLREALLQANREEAEDAAQRAEMALWDATLADGLEGSDS